MKKTRPIEEIQEILQTCGEKLTELGHSIAAAHLQAAIDAAKMSDNLALNTPCEH